MTHPAKPDQRRKRATTVGNRPDRRPGGGAGRAGRPPAGPRASEGLAARDCAVSAIYSVFTEKRSFDDAFNAAADTRQLTGKDRALARMIATTVLRHRATLAAAIGKFLTKPLPEKQGRLEAILAVAAAQLLYLKTPPHAVISLAVDQCHSDRSARNFAKLANAVLRKVSVGGDALLQTVEDPVRDIPAWLMARWQAHYGETTAKAIARASLREAALDLTVPRDDNAWAERLGGVVLVPGTVRLAGGGRIEDMDGFADGAWWVQDAAAAMPARLLGGVDGLRVLDMCSAPGGKAAQLAAAGALVTALDKSPGRLKRVVENFRRLRLDVTTVATDAASYRPAQPFDAVLVDAPCSATGTIRRHPDILHLKRATDLPRLIDIQSRILSSAADAVKVGGLIVYCTCSLEPEEGEQQIERFLAARPEFERLPIAACDLAAEGARLRQEAAKRWLTEAGDVRLLPFHFDAEASGLDDAQTGCDGFFIARLRRTADRPMTAI